ncbi:MAG: hypothetical protein J6T60_16075 [Bacteroidales bacterium]|nr:hypothetical protein [Bacteroidales bacterium]
MGFLSFLFGEKAPETALGEPVAPETLPADGNYPNSMPIIYSYFMNPSPTEGGLKLARRYKNRCAVLGVVQKGAFQANDYVIVSVGGKPTKVQALDVIEFEFEFYVKGGFLMKDRIETLNSVSELSMDEIQQCTVPIANTAWGSHKPLGEGKSAWIILELTVKPDPNTTVVKL